MIRSTTKRKSNRRPLNSQRKPMLVCSSMRFLMFSSILGPRGNENVICLKYCWKRRCGGFRMEMVLISQMVPMKQMSQRLLMEQILSMATQLQPTQQVLKTLISPLCLQRVHRRLIQKCRQHLLHLPPNWLPSLHHSHKHYPPPSQTQTISLPKLCSSTRFWSTRMVANSFLKIVCLEMLNLEHWVAQSLLPFP